MLKVFFIYLFFRFFLYLRNEISFKVYVTSTLKESIVSTLKGFFRTSLSIILT
jgi:hypothetical protein